MQHVSGNDRKRRHHQEPRQMAICKPYAPRANIHEPTGACQARTEYPRAFQPATYFTPVKSTAVPIGGFG